MIQSLLASVHDYWGWFVGILGLSAALSWIPGGGAAIGIAVSALKIFASAIEAASPIISGIFSGIIWIWQKVLWPGLLNIFSNWATLFTVITLGGFIWFGVLADYKIKHFSDQTALSKCYQQISKNKNKLPDPEPEIGLQLPWPFNWK